MATFFDKYKVLIFGFLSSLALPLYDLIQHGETSTPTIILSVGTAIVAFVARNFRGQWATISGLVLSTLITYFSNRDGHPSIAAILLQFVIQLGFLFAPPAKSRDYEHAPAIMEAKRQGEASTPTLAPPQP